MAFLDELESAFRGVSDRVGPAVVRVGRWHGGAGVVVADGIVLTNAHNVRGENVSVSFSDGRDAEGQVAGIDVDADLAVIGVDTTGVTALEWAEHGAAIGTPVFALTAGTSGGRVTFGFVSGVDRSFRGPRGRRISGSIEHTAPLARGSSGSPLVDRDGRFLGLNTNRVGTGFYLALPADESLRERVSALQRGEPAERPRLGVAIAPAWVANRMRRAVGLPEVEGVLVREVEPLSPAGVAGLREGDMIIAAGGRPVREADDLYDALGSIRTGSTLGLRLVRGADEVDAEIRFGDATEGSAPVH